MKRNKAASDSDKNFQTRDLGLAAALYFRCPKSFVRLEPDGKLYWFVFRGPGIADLAESYWRGDLRGSLKGFWNSVRSVKDLLFARSR